MDNLKFKFIQILYKYAETLTIRTGVLASAEEDEWVWLGNDEQIATECTELCRKLQKEAFEASRKTKWPVEYCKIPNDMLYETFEEFIEEK